MKKVNRRMFVYGFLAWLVPFLTAFLFYTPQGQLMIDQQLFKSIMIVEGGVVGAFLLVKYFGRVEEGFLREGIVLGLVWLLLNWLLDLLTLVLVMKMNVVEYFGSIGLRYLMMPIMSVAMGWILEKKCVSGCGGECCCGGSCGEC